LCNRKSHVLCALLGGVWPVNVQGLLVIWQPSDINFPSASFQIPQTYP